MLSQSREHSQFREFADALDPVVGVSGEGEPLEPIFGQAQLGHSLWIAPGLEHVVVEPGALDVLGDLAAPQGPTARHHCIDERLRWPPARGRGLARGVWRGGQGFLLYQKRKGSPHLSKARYH